MLRHLRLYRRHSPPEGPRSGLLGLWNSNNIPRFQFNTFPDSNSIHPPIPVLTVLWAPQLRISPGLLLPGWEIIRPIKSVGSEDGLQVPRCTSRGLQGSAEAPTSVDPACFLMSRPSHDPTGTSFTSADPLANGSADGCAHKPYLAAVACANSDTDQEPVRSSNCRPFRRAYIHTNTCPAQSSGDLACFLMSRPSHDPTIALYARSLPTYQSSAATSFLPIAAARLSVTAAAVQRSSSTCASPPRAREYAPPFCADADALAHANG